MPRKFSNATFIGNHISLNFKIANDVLQKMPMPGRENYDNLFLLSQTKIVPNFITV